MSNNIPVEDQASPQNPLSWRIFHHDYIIPSKTNNNTNWLNDWNEDPNATREQLYNYPTWFAWKTQKEFSEGFRNLDETDVTKQQLYANLVPGDYPTETEVFKNDYPSV